MQNSTYWQERAERRITHGDKTTDAVIKDIVSEHAKAKKSIQSQISQFYADYFTDGVHLQEVYKKLNSTELKDFRSVVTQYKNDIGKTSLFAETEINKMQGYIERKSVSRLDKIMVDFEARIYQLSDVEYQKMTGGLEKVYTDDYYRTIFDTQQGLGFGSTFNKLNSEVITKVLNTKWIGDNYSNRIWANKDKLIGELRTTFLHGVAMGYNSNKIGVELSKRLGVSENRGKTLARTEFGHIMGQATKEGYKQTNVKRYQYVATLDGRTSDICQELDLQIFNLSEAQEGVNYPEMHPNCVHPDTVMYAPECEQLIKSKYSGDIIKFTTSSGRTFTVTPNHIMLTTRGWVRAKFIVKGDDVINYLGWDEFIKSPTNDNSIPTVEQCFTSFSESFNVSTISMPATTENLKGDVVKNSNIDIIFINSLLSNKGNTPFLKFFTDSNLIIGNSNGKGFLLRQCSFNKFLMCTGYVFDSFVSFFSIPLIFFFRPFRHHKSISLSATTRYESRLSETSINNPCTNSKHTSYRQDAFSIFMKFFKNINIKFNPFVRIPNVNTVFSKNTPYWAITNRITTSNFAKAFSSVVSTDNIVDIQVSFYNGHVYDASTSSTLYLANGFLSSNCRSTTVPYFDDEDDTRLARDEEGSNYEVPSNMSYTKWKELNNI